MPKKEELSPAQQLWLINPKCKPSEEAIRRFVALDSDPEQRHLPDGPPD